MAIDIRPFTVSVPQADLDDLRARLQRTRLPVDFANDDWRYGTNRAWLETLVAYWINQYDWRKHEAQMNAYPNFKADIDGVPVHFLHIRGKGPKPMPLVLTHGWPWTFWDFNKLIDPLTDPGRFGGDPADSFDLILPSIPGYGFSSPLTQTGIGTVKTADLWVQLLREGLGYERFGAQGGDWGAIITATIGARHPDAVYGVHMSMPSIPGSVGRLRQDDWGPGEEEWPQRMATRMQTAASHLAVNTNDPQTLAYALNDSPAGLAAWICERRMDFGDTNGNIESRFTKDHLITTVMLYWVTQTFGTACRYYMENRDNPFTVAEDVSPIITAPAGFAVFPMELPFIPRKLAERETNLKRWTVMPRGGHYAAAEEPELLMEDIRAFFRPLRPA